GMTFGPELVLRGAIERLSPILMTALATGLALVPLVVAGDVPGHEIEFPMVVVLLGGLVGSTVFNLFVVPSLTCGSGPPARRRMCWGRSSNRVLAHGMALITQKRNKSERRRWVMLRRAMTYLAVSAGLVGMCLAPAAGAEE